MALGRTPSSGDYRGVLAPFDRARGPMSEALEREGEAAARYGMGEAGGRLSRKLSVLPQAVEEDLRANAAKGARRITSRMREDARKVLADSYRQGLSLDETTSRLKERLDDMATWECRRIAATEINSAINRATFEAYRSSGEVTYVKWITRADTRVRYSHRSLHGESVKLGRPFSNGLRFPGEAAGSPRETINCRCHIVPALSASGGAGGGGRRPPGPPPGGGGGEERPIGPDEPEGPNIEWFRTATFDPRKFDPYLFNPDHPDNQGKAEGWRRIFGIGEGDGALLRCLILEQLDQATPEEQTPRAFREDLSRGARRWELVISHFEGPNGNVAPVVTAWALDPGRSNPHFVTAIARSEEDR